jgi:hypothetical protein
MTRLGSGQANYPTRPDPFGALHAAAIKHFQNVVGPSRSPFKTLNELPKRWKNRYTPIADINPDIYQLVMAPINDAELRTVINNSPTRKAPGPLPYHMNGLSFYLLIGFLIFVD